MKNNITFIGGCINNQKGFPKEKLFHQVLQNNSNQKLNIGLGTYLSLNTLPERLTLNISKHKPETVYLFIRPFPLMPLFKPFIKYDLANKKKKIAFHPALITRKMEWDNKLSNYQIDNQYQYSAKSRFGKRDMNIMLGCALGLHFWAVKYLQHILKQCIEICKNNSVELILISPPAYPTSIMGNWICKYITNKVDRFSKLHQLRFVNIYTFPESCFEVDKIHFNIEGHNKLANTIAQF